MPANAQHRHSYANRRLYKIKNASVGIANIVQGGGVPATNRKTSYADIHSIYTRDYASVVMPT